MSAYGKLLLNMKNKSNFSTNLNMKTLRNYRYSLLLPSLARFTIPPCTLLLKFYELKTFTLTVYLFPFFSENPYHVWDVKKIQKFFNCPRPFLYLLSPFCFQVASILLVLIRTDKSLVKMSLGSLKMSNYLRCSRFIKI